MLSRHISTGKRRATHPKRPDAVKPSPKYAETTRPADVGVSGAGPKARQVDLVQLQRHGFTGMALYRQGSKAMALKGTTVQARLYRHGPTGTARHSSAGAALQAGLYRRDSSGMAVYCCMCELTCANINNDFEGGERIKVV